MSTPITSSSSKIVSVNNNSSIHPPQPVQGTLCSRIITIIKKTYNKLIETIYWLFSFCFDQIVIEKKTPKPVTHAKKIDLTCSHFGKLPDDVKKFLVNYLEGPDQLSLYRTSKTEATFFEKKLSKKLHKAQLEEEVFEYWKKLMESHTHSSMFFDQLIELTENLIPNCSEKIVKYCVETILSKAADFSISQEVYDLVEVVSLLKILNLCSVEEHLKSSVRAHLTQLMQQLMPRVESFKTKLLFNFILTLAHFDLKNAIWLMNRHSGLDITANFCLFNINDSNLDEMITTINSINRPVLKELWFEELANKISKNEKPELIEKLLPYIEDEDIFWNFYARKGDLNKFLQIKKNLNITVFDSFNDSAIKDLVLNIEKNPQREKFIDGLFEAWSSDKIGPRMARGHYIFLAITYRSCNQDKSRTHFEEALKLFDDSVSDSIEKADLYFEMGKLNLPYSEKEFFWKEIMRLKMPFGEKVNPNNYRLLRIIYQKLKTDRKQGEEAFKEYLGDKKPKDVMEYKYDPNILHFIDICAFLDSREAERLVKLHKVDYFSKCRFLLRIASQLS